MVRTCTLFRLSACLLMLLALSACGGALRPQQADSGQTAMAPESVAESPVPAQQSPAPTRPDAEDMEARLARQQKLSEDTAGDLLGDGFLRDFAVLGAQSTAGNRQVQLYERKNPQWRLDFTEWARGAWATDIDYQKPESLRQLAAMWRGHYLATGRADLGSHRYPVILYGSEPQVKQADGFALVLKYPQGRVVLVKGQAPSAGLAALQGKAIPLINRSKLTRNLLAP